MPDASKAGVSAPAAVARAAERTLARLARPAGGFDASRYFRDSGALQFYNVGTSRMRQMAKDIVRAHRDRWSVDDALRFADLLIKRDVLEVKGLGIEALARFRRDFAPAHLPIWKRWLAGGYASNWATTDSICGSLIGPLLLQRPELVPSVVRWTAHRNLWVRRASAVALIPTVRLGGAVAEAYGVARRLHGDPADLIQKAVGWMLREAGNADPRRLERYLRTHGRRIPRTTVRYAIERFPERLRRELLAVTRPSQRQKV
jgi:3-methyladenine DNA glycosylase AlkD